MPRFGCARCVALVALILVLTACATEDHTGGSATAPNRSSHTSATPPPDSVTQTVLAEVSEYVDTSSSQAWVDWGSYLAVVVVTGETEVPVAPLTGTTEAPLEVSSNRDITLTIESVVWEHPGAVLSLVPQQEIRIRLYDGWVKQDGETLAVRYEGQIRPEVDQTYLMVLAEGAKDSPDGFTNLPGSVQPIAEGKIQRAGSEWDQRTPEQVGAALGELTPNPKAAPVAGEELQDRILRVLDILGD